MSIFKVHSEGPEKAEQIWRPSQKVSESTGTSSQLRKERHCLREWHHFPAEPPGRLNCSICIFWYQIHFTFPQYLTKQNNHLLLSTFSNNSQPTLTSLYSTQVASKCFATFLESFGAWWAAVYGVAQSRTRLEQLSSSSSRVFSNESALHRDSAVLSSCDAGLLEPPERPQGPELWSTGSIAVEHGHNCSMACGVFPVLLLLSCSSRVRLCATP